MKTRIIDEFRQRLEELNAIAKEKGITTFGYHGPTPDEWDEIEDEDFDGEDLDDGEIENNADMYFSPEEADNYIRCGAIIEMIESQLGIY